MLTRTHEDDSLFFPTRPDLQAAATTRLAASGEVGADFAGLREPVDRARWLAVAREAAGAAQTAVDAYAADNRRSYTGDTGAGGEASLLGSSDGP